MCPCTCIVLRKIRVTHYSVNLFLCLILIVVFMFPPLGSNMCPPILTLCPHTMVYLVIQCMCARFSLSSFGILEGNKSPELFSCVIYCVFFTYFFSLFCIINAEVYKTICTSLFNIIIFSQFYAIM